MKVSVHFAPERLPVFLESVQLAEAFGCGRVWLFDSHLIFHDVYVYATRALAATERICVGPAVTNPVTRHLTVTASAIATLAQLHPGRVVLGIGRGDSALRTLGREPTPTRQLAALVPLLRDLVAGRPVELDGTQVRITWAHEDVPIMLAATGPKNARLAGALADIVMLQVGTDPASVRWAIEHVRAGARAAARDPDAIEISLVCAMWVADDLAAALAACRWAPISAVNHLEEAARRNPGEPLPEPLAHLVEARRGSHHDYYSHLDASGEGAYLTDELIDAFSLAGPAERCLARMSELAALGVGEVSFLCTEPGQLERIGREIIPALGW